MLNIAVYSNRPQNCEAIEGLTRKVLQGCCFLPFTIHKFDSIDDFNASANEEVYRIALVQINTNEEWEPLQTTHPCCKYIYIMEDTLHFSGMNLQNTYLINHMEIEKFLPLALTHIITGMEKENNKILCIQRQGEYICIPEKDIIFIERNKRITQITTPDHLDNTYEKLENLEKGLSDFSFVRCHRSYMVNFAYVRKFKRTEFHCEGDYVIPISRSYYESVKKAFSRFLARQL